MTAEQRPVTKRFTRTEAHKALPLVTSIVRDIVELHADLEQRRERLGELRVSRKGPRQRPETDPYEEEFRQMEDDLATDDGRLRGYCDELSKLGVELKDAKAGTVEFPSVGLGHLVWRLGEADVQEVYTTGA
jgi:hypothetical protein